MYPTRGPKSPFAFRLLSGGLALDSLLSPDKEHLLGFWTQGVHPTFKDCRDSVLAVKNQELLLQNTFSLEALPSVITPRLKGAKEPGGQQESPGSTYLYEAMFQSMAAHKGDDCYPLEP